MYVQKAGPLAALPFLFMGPMHRNLLRMCHSRAGGNPSEGWILSGRPAYSDSFFSLFLAPSFVTGFWSEYPDSFAL